MKTEFSYCSAVVDHCGKNPCQNEATCVNFEEGYQCECKTGYSGSNCETGDDIQLKCFVKIGLRNIILATFCCKLFP